MATHHGNSGAVYIGAAAVAEVTAASYNENDVSIVDDSSIGDTSVSYLSGGKIDGSGSITCHFDETDSTGQEAMLTALTGGTTVTLNIYVEGSGAGNHERSGSVLIESYDLTLDQGAVVGCTFNFKGVLTAGTQ